MGGIKASNSAAIILGGPFLSYCLQDQHFSFALFLLGLCMRFRGEGSDGGKKPAWQQRICRWIQASLVDAFFCLCIYFKTAVLQELLADLT